MHSHDLHFAPWANLPTVETCPYRRSEPRSTLAVCDLAADLLKAAGAFDEPCDIAADEATRVTRETCATCCAQFPPNPARLNPVVASLVYRAADRVSELCRNTRLTLNELRARAQSAMQSLGDRRAWITPVRTTRACRFLGQPIPDTDAAGAESQRFACHHSNHATTTAGHCDRCRDWSSTPPVSAPACLAQLIGAPQERSGRTVSSWAVGVTTSPRRQPTLHWCLQSLERAGWKRPHVFVDGAVRIPERYSHLPIHWRERAAGPWPAWYSALSELVIANPDADAYLLVQDDAWMHDREDLRAWLERVLWPGRTPGIVSLYSSRNAAAPGWIAHPRGWSLGAVAFVLASDAARTILCDTKATASAIQATGHVRPIDAVLSDVALRQRIEIWSTYPSLVQHTGNTSTIWGDAGNAGYRCAPLFSGDIDEPFAAEDRFDEFPEMVFPCPSQLAESYRRRIQLGQRKMAASRVVICTLCRDVRHLLPRTAARIERLGSLFADYQVVAFENDSRDATLGFLNDWSRTNERVHVLHDQLKTPRFPSGRSRRRAAWMAAYRNRYHRYVLERLADADFVIVVDSDLSGGWSYDGVCDSFGFAEWDYIGSYGLLRVTNSRGRFPWLHFDTWAFQADDQASDAFRKRPQEIVLKRGAPLVPVRSCFGGLGIYTMAAWSASHYAGPHCEHVMFHRRMRRAGYKRLFLNPSQIVLYSHW